MEKYYIHDGNSQLGPFSITQLKERGIGKDTPVWYEGLEEWTLASNIKELAAILNSRIPPPYAPSHKNDPNNPITKKKKFRLGKLLLIVVCLAIAVVLISFIGTRLTGRNSSYYENVMTVEEQEKADPARFLKTTGKYRTNFWGDKVTIDGTLHSSATVANFKDVVVRVTFFSATETAISEKNYILYDYFPAHSSKGFKLKIEWPAGAKSCGVDPISATPY